jgi:DNA-binding transcriptional MerR regulator
MADDKTMTIREMCETFDVTPRTLRFYEAKELLFPVRRGTQRLFTRQCRARLKLILRGKRFGFSLEELRQLLDLYGMGGAAQLERTCEVATRHLKDMETRRSELDEAIAALKVEIARGTAELARLARAAPEAAA